MIKPEQMTAYDDAAKVVRAAVDSLNKINLARLDPADRERIAKPIAELQTLGAYLFSEAYDAFLVARGLKEPATTNRTEAYWTERNALVDAVHAANAACRKRADGWGLDSTDTDAYAKYTAALDALKAFDAARGGAPIL